MYKHKFSYLNKTHKEKIKKKIKDKWSAYISQSSHLGSETSDLIIQIGMHWINPQLDFIRAGCWSCAKTLPEEPSFIYQHQTKSNKIETLHSVKNTLICMEQHCHRPPLERQEFVFGELA